MECCSQQDQDTIHALSTGKIKWIQESNNSHIPPSLALAANLELLSLQAFIAATPLSQCLGYHHIVQSCPCEL